MEHAETKHLERAPARGAVRPAHGRSRAAALLHAVRRRHRADPGAARGAQPAGLRSPALRLSISGADSGGGGGHSPERPSLHCRTAWQARRRPRWLCGAGGDPEGTPGRDPAQLRLFDLPTDEAALLRYYTLSDDDIEQIRVRRGGHNRLGFALQLCAFRYPGRIPVAGEAIPRNVLRFIAAQLGRRAADLDGYAVREETRREHLAEIRRSYGYRMFPYVPSLGALRPGPEGLARERGGSGALERGAGAAVRGGVPAPACDPARIIGPGASWRGRTRRRRAPDRDAHRRGLGRCHAPASRPAAYPGCLPRKWTAA